MYTEYLSMCQGFPLSPQQTTANLVPKFCLSQNRRLSQARKIPKKWEGKENQIETDYLNQKQSICYKEFAFSTEKPQESRIQGAVILIFLSRFFYPDFFILGFFSAYIPPELYSTRLEINGLRMNFQDKNWSNTCAVPGLG